MPSGDCNYENTSTTEASRSGWTAIVRERQYWPAKTTRAQANGAPEQPCGEPHGFVFSFQSNIARSEVGRRRGRRGRPALRNLPAGTAGISEEMAFALLQRGQRQQFRGESERRAKRPRKNPGRPFSSACWNREVSAWPSIDHVPRRRR